jgi:hypothetical protein
MHNKSIKMSQASEYYPEFFEPKPISPKRKLSEKKTLVIRKRASTEIIIDIISMLGKRKLSNAFGLEIYNDKERYGQEIPADFFVTNFGHGVI